MKKILLIIAIILLMLQMIVLAVAIDIGSPATNRGITVYTVDYTNVDKNNAANLSGTITSVEIWANEEISGCEVATFYVVSGNNLSTRDIQAIGTVTPGSKQTFNVDLDVEAGDYIGLCGTSGSIEGDNSGGGGLWQKAGDQIPCSNVAFSFGSGYIFSLYGTGTTTEEEGNAIFFGTNL